MTGEMKGDGAYDRFTDLGGIRRDDSAEFGRTDGTYPRKFGVEPELSELSTYQL
jgi:hypothetical protein